MYSCFVRNNKNDKKAYITGWDNGLVSPGKKLVPELKLPKPYDTIKYHQGPVGNVSSRQ